MIFVRFFLSCLFICFAVSAYAANGETQDLVEWQMASSPFARSQSLNNLSIASSVSLNQQTGARANVTWSCTKNGTEFAVGITNGDLDFSPKTNALRLQTKIDNGAVTTFDVMPESARRFVIADHLDPRVLFADNIKAMSKMGKLYIGFPANGEDVVLRINFQDVLIRQFMTGCLEALHANAKKQPEVAQIQPQTKPQKVVAQAQPTQHPAPVVTKRSEIDLALVPPAPKPKSPSNRVEAQQLSNADTNIPAPRDIAQEINLKAGDEVGLRPEYVFEATHINIGAVYSNVPHRPNDKIDYRLGDVGLGGDEGSRNETLVVTDVHKANSGRKDWYRVKVNCPECSQDSSKPTEGWVAANDLNSWMDDPLCVKGSEGCN